MAFVGFVNPWDIQMAFDNSPVDALAKLADRVAGDAYRHRLRARPKAWDQVRVETSRDHAKAQLRLETQDDSKPLDHSRRESRADRYHFRVDQRVVQ
jgi:hypothetical protein